MTLLYYDPIFLQHDTGMHPEQAPRLSRIMSHLSALGLDQRCQRPTWESVSTPRLTRIHQLSYVNSLAQFAQHGGGRIEIDTIVSPRSYEVARRAAGAVCDAVERVVRGEDSQAICLVRPPGHHALEDGAMGFCLFNNIAIGARLATAELGLERVLIVDWDVHHGNGTQDAFWEDEQVGFFSIHRYPFYPGTGSADEIGGGKGRGTTLNLPIRFGTSRRDYLNIFTSKLEQFAAKIQPQLILISAGYDSHRLDPIGSLGLEVEDFSVLTQVVLDIASAYAADKIVSVLEGGYNLDVLPKCVETHLEELLRRQPQ
jgi:acetoin utilization deacetylase AcuC-like enzyme